MKNIFDTKNRSKGSNNGFTLIELLATIAILSMVTTLVLYVSLNVVRDTKDKSYEVTINNIQKQASSYVVEENNNVLWFTGVTDDYQYQCMTVQNLIDAGYFKGDILNSYVAEDVKVNSNNYIYLERDKKNKTITRSVLLVNDKLKNYGGLCDNIKASGVINITANPNEWSINKHITLEYNVINNLDLISNYKYDYVYQYNNSVEDMVYTNKFNRNYASEEIDIYDNGSLYASIKDKTGEDVINASIIISTIDNVGPIISENYSGNSVVRNNVIIPIKVVDNESGLTNNLSLSHIVVTIGNVLIKDGLNLEKVDNNNYKLIINNNVDYGSVKIVIDENKLLDKVNNGNKKTELLPKVGFTNKYSISYDKNNGTGSMNSTECTYGSSCTLRNNSFTRTGYTFLGWSTSSSGKVEYNNSAKFDYNKTTDLKLYAIWEANKYNIYYNANGGTGSMDNTECTFGKSCTLSNNSFTRTGYTFKGWVMSASADDVQYSNGAKITYTLVSDITLYAIWKDETKPTISFGTNGNSAWSKSVSTTINVSDSGSGVRPVSLKYIFSTDSNATPNVEFTNGATVSLSGVSGKYYLRVYACDAVSNCTTVTSNVFKLDNIPPTVSCDSSVATLNWGPSSGPWDNPMTITSRENCAVYGIITNKQGGGKCSNWTTLNETDNNGVYNWDYSSRIVNEDGVVVDNLQKTKGNCNDGYCRWEYTMKVWDQAGNEASGTFTYFVKY